MLTEYIDQTEEEILYGVVVNQFADGSPRDKYA